MSEETKPRGVAARLAAVLAALGPVEKTGKNSHFRYAYHSIDDITGAVRSGLGAEGVAVGTKIDHFEIEEYDKGRRATVVLTVTFRCSETDEEMTTQGIGQGEDKNDKAFLKAQTAAFKYAIRHAFLISEGGHDPDRDGGEQGSVRRERTPERQERQAPTDYSGREVWKKEMRRWHSIAGGTDLSKEEIAAHKEWTKRACKVKRSAHVSPELWKRAADKLHELGGDAADYMRENAVKPEAV